MAKRIGRAVLLAASAALLILPMLLIAHPIAYVPFVAALLLVCASWLYLQLMRRSISASVAGMVSSCERGQKTALSVSLANRSALPCSRVQMSFYVTDLFGDFDDTRTIACSVRAREDMALGIDVSFAHLGTYYAGISNVVVYDLLGLFSASLGDGARQQVTVRPRKVSMGPASALTAVPDESRKSLKPVAADDVDYANVREYRFGDSLKSIHWNLTARNPNGTMFTRLYEAYVNPSLCVVIDPCADAADSERLMSLFDGMVEVAAALCAQARAAGIDAEVRYVNKDGAPAAARLATPADADDLVSDMMRIVAAREAEGVAGLADGMLREAGLRSHGSGNVALVTPRPDATQVSTLSEIAMNRRNAMAFLAVPRDLSGKEREKYLAPMRQLSRAGASWWAVESNEIATEVIGL